MPQVFILDSLILIQLTHTHQYAGGWAGRRLLQGGRCGRGTDRRSGPLATIGCDHSAIASGRVRCRRGRRASSSCARIGAAAQAQPPAVIADAVRLGPADVGEEHYSRSPCGGSAGIGLPHRQHPHRSWARHCLCQGGDGDALGTRHLLRGRRRGRKTPGRFAPRD